MLSAVLKIGVCVEISTGSSSPSDTAQLACLSQISKLLYIILCPFSIPPFGKCMKPHFKSAAISTSDFQLANDVFSDSISILSYDFL